MKNFNNGSQQTLFDSWRLDYYSEKNEESNKKQSKKPESSASAENITDDDIIASSQSESKLRKRIKKNLSLKSLTPKSKSIKNQKNKNKNNKLSINKSEISSTTLKNPEENFPMQVLNNNQNQSMSNLSILKTNNFKVENNSKKVTFDSDNDDEDISEDILLVS